jgi:hypothetical protein
MGILIHLAQPPQADCPEDVEDGSERVPQILSVFQIFFFVSEINYFINLTLRRKSSFEIQLQKKPCTIIKRGKLLY